jgi:chromosome segregation ATPase
MNPVAGYRKLSAEEAAKLDPNFLPEATDELITEYRNRFRIMTNLNLGGCLVSPQGEYNNGSDYYLLTQSQSMQVTNMIRLLLKRVDGDKAIIQDLSTLKAVHENQLRDLKARNQVLHEKIVSADVKFAKMLERLSTIQHEVDVMRDQRTFGTNNKSNDLHRIDALETELREANDRNAVLQNKLRKMASMQTDMSEVDTVGQQAIIRENQELKHQLQITESQNQHLTEAKKRYIQEIYALEDRKKSQCGEACRFVKEDLANVRLTADRLDEEVRDLSSQLASRETIIETQEKRLNHAKLFVRMLLTMYPDVDPYHIHGVMKRVLREK